MLCQYRLSLPRSKIKLSWVKEKENLSFSWTSCTFWELLKLALNSEEHLISFPTESDLTRKKNYQQAKEFVTGLQDLELSVFLEREIVLNIWLLSLMVWVLNSSAYWSFEPKHARGAVPRSDHLLHSYWQRIMTFPSAMTPLVLGPLSSLLSFQSAVSVLILRNCCSYLPKRFTLSPNPGCVVLRWPYPMPLLSGSSVWSSCCSFLSRFFLLSAVISGKVKMVPPARFVGSIYVCVLIEKPFANNNWSTGNI